MRAGRPGVGGGWGGEEGAKRGGEITSVYNVHPRGEGLAYFMGWFYLLGIFLVGEGGVWCDVMVVGDRFRWDLGQSCGMVGFFACVVGGGWEVGLLFRRGGRCAGG